MSTILTRELADPSVVTPFLRGDVLGNCGMLASIERNIPPFPRTVWAALDGDETVGTMLVTDGPGQGHVSLRTTRSEAVSALLGCLDRGRVYAFSVPADLLEAFHLAAPTAIYKSQTIVLSARMADLRSFPLVLSYRRLSAADRPMVQVFPESAPYEPPLAMYLDWAMARPEGLAMYGVFDGDTLVGHIGWAVQIEPVWEATFVRVLSNRQGQGLGRALVSQSTRDLLAAGHVPLYELHGDNVASLRIALAAGYHEVMRVHHFQAAE